MKKLDLTFENWWNGDIELSGSYKSRSTDNLNQTIQTESIDDFPKEQQLLIQDKQLTLFEQYVSSLTNKFKADFNNRYVNAPSPADLLSIEAKRIAGIIRGDIIQQDDEHIYFLQGNLVMPRIAFDNIQNSINHRIKGEPIPTAHIPSPNSKLYSVKDLLPEVYVESLINQYLHLGKFDPSIHLEDLFEAPFKMLYSNEPINPNTTLFTSGWGYLAFLWCEELLIQKFSKSGDYAQILKVLKHPKVNAIPTETTHKEFIEFINSTRDLNLSYKYAKPSTSEIKENVVKFVLRKYLLQMEMVDRENVEIYLQQIIEQKTT